MESVEAKGPNRRRAQEGLAVIVDSIYFKGHSCFRNEWSGFDTIKSINVIIGRNNAGKSHLLELVEALCSGPCQNRGLTLSTSMGALHRRETSRSDRTFSRSYCAKPASSQRVPRRRSGESLSSSI